MDLSLCPGEVPTFFFFDFTTAPYILYYSYFPTIIVSLIVGIYILIRDNFSLLSKLLLAVALSFSFWILNVLVQWVASYSDILMFSWQLTAFFEILIFISTVYFVHAFVFKEDIVLRFKILLLFIIFPIILLLPTTYNIYSYHFFDCEGEIGSLWYYIYLLEVASFVGVILIGFKGYKNSIYDELFKKQIFYVTLGAASFLGVFMGFNMLAEAMQSYQIGLVGPLGMALFLFFLGYVIMKYRAFNIKLIQTQALVLVLWVMVGSLLFVVRSTPSRIITSLTLVTVVIFGYFLVKSVKREVEQRERLEALTTELQKTTKSLANANSKLESANKELERLDQAKSEFLSIASHQLRTPLTVIKGYTSMLQEGSFGKVPVKIGEVLDKVFISTERLISLVESLLNISRIEAGRIQFDLQPVDLTKTINELVTDFQQKAAAKKLVLEFTPDKEVPTAMTDPQKVKEIISNLLDNAIKYTEKGSINVGLHQESQSIVFTSQDTGLGIEPEDLPRLFNKFVRGKGMQQVHTEGTGLGLYFARMVVEQMGGRIWAESEGKGKGSKFSFSLPVADKNKVMKIK